jgi:hypothetical protein
VAVGDFNGDGKPDLVIANGDFADVPVGGSDDTISELLNTTPTGATTPSFSAQATFATGMRPRSVALGDFNGDGGLDLAVANLLSGTASVLLGNGTTRITRPQATGTILEDDVPVTVNVVNGTSPQSAVVNAAFATPLAVDVRNAAGNLVQNVSVTFAAPGTGPSGTFGGSTSVTVVTNASGRATAPTFVANTIAGSYAVLAQAQGGSNPSASFGLTNTPGPPAALTATAGSNQTTTVNSAFTINLAATLTDQYGNGVPGVIVTFSSPTFGASATFVGGPTATTDAGGRVSKGFRANEVAGSYTIAAAATGGSPTASFANLNNTPDVPAFLFASVGSGQSSLYQPTGGTGQ